MKQKYKILMLHYFLLDWWSFFPFVVIDDSEFWNKKLEIFLSDFITRNSVELVVKYLKIQDNLESKLQSSNRKKWKFKTRN